MKIDNRYRKNYNVPFSSDPNAFQEQTVSTPAVVAVIAAAVIVVIGVVIGIGASSFSY